MSKNVILEPMSQEELQFTGSLILGFINSHQAEVRPGVNDHTLTTLFAGQCVAVVGGDPGSDLHVGRFWAPMSGVREMPHGLHPDTLFPYWSNFQMLKELGRAMLRIAGRILAQQRVDVWFDAGALWFAGQDKRGQWFARRIPLGTLLEHASRLRLMPVPIPGEVLEGYSEAQVRGGFSLVELHGKRGRHERYLPPVEMAASLLEASGPSAHDSLMRQYDQLELLMLQESRQPDSIS